MIRFGLTDCIPLDKGEASLAEIAHGSPLGEATIGRLLRHACAHHIFQEPRKNVFSHTAASQMLASNPQIRQFLGMVMEEMWPAATKVSKSRSDHLTK